jgi:predicted ribosome quality control (RQC) complex YloA/Tae2 family protein
LDNLVLVRVAVELAATLPDTTLEELRQEGAERFVLTFLGKTGAESLAVSMRPERPWISGPARRRVRSSWSPVPFAADAARALVGRRVLRVVKPSADRSIVIEFTGGGGLAVELATHGANLVLLGAAGEVVAVLRQTPSSRNRLAIGTSYASRPLPRGQLDPWSCSIEDVDRLLAAGLVEGESPLDALSRGVFGVGNAGARLVLEEAAATGRLPGEVLRARLHALGRGEQDPVVECDNALGEEAPIALWPWPPAPVPGRIFRAAGPPSATAGLYYEAIEAAETTASHIAGLRAILDAELRRTGAAAAKVAGEAASFHDPDRFGRMGEALLAGLTAAKRHGDTVIVPDPYDENGGELVIEAQPGRPLTDVANALFGRQRRARRGREAVRERAATLSARAERLESLVARYEAASGEWGLAALESAMQREGLPVGLTAPTRAARAASRMRAPRLAGVRMVTSTDGWTILVGRTGRDNDTLTFKISGPEDLWLHAAGVAGAHVVIRSTGRGAAAPERTIREAAVLAAWYSDARGEGQVDVQWTRRKNVRRAPGAASGRVMLKRFETLRVTPVRPRIDV